MFVIVGNCVICFFIFLMFVGDVVVYMVFYLNGNLRMCVNVFFLSFVILDILFVVFVLFFEIVCLLCYLYWFFGEMVCNIWNLVFVVFGSVLICYLCVISIDWFFVILCFLCYFNDILVGVFVFIVFFWLFVFLSGFGSYFIWI